MNIEGYYATHKTASCLLHYRLMKRRRSNRRKLVLGQLFICVYITLFPVKEKNRINWNKKKYLI